MSLLIVNSIYMSTDSQACGVRILSLSRFWGTWGGGDRMFSYSARIPPSPKKFNELVFGAPLGPRCWIAARTCQSVSLAHCYLKIVSHCVGSGAVHCFVERRMNSEFALEIPVMRLLLIVWSEIDQPFDLCGLKRGKAIIWSLRVLVHVVRISLLFVASYVKICF